MNLRAPNCLNVGEKAVIEACTPQPSSFLPTLLGEDAATSLIERGYAVVELASQVTQTYSDFHAAFESFSHLSKEEKQVFATQQFNNSTISPNQFHGFTEVGGLKEQFMMRVCGKGSSLITPGEYFHDGRAVDLGVCGMKLYEYLDQLCRKMAGEVTEKLHMKRVDGLLDDVGKVGKKVERDKNNNMVCYSEYVIPGYISSSIIDNFHYYNSFKKENQGDERVYNLAAHTDSGLLTVVVVTDVPGLEVFDQKLKQWIALEQMLHEYLPSVGKKPRQYATIFWGESVDNLKSSQLKATSHRVGKNEMERYSVVFKQRISPLRAPCRYHALAELQKQALNDEAKRRTNVQNPFVFVGLALAIVAIGLSWMKR